MGVVKFPMEVFRQFFFHLSRHKCLNDLQLKLAGIVLRYRRCSKRFSKKRADWGSKLGRIFIRIID